MDWNDFFILAPVIIVFVFMCYIDCCRKPSKGEDEEKDE